LVVAALVLLQAGAGRGAPAPARVGFDAATFDPIVQSGIRAGAYPGAVLVVGRADTILSSKGYGRFTWSPRSAAVDPDSTLFDLASLTKIVATTSALMVLVERGVVRLDAPVRTYLPELQAAGTEGLTVRHLLTHTSGCGPPCRSIAKRMPRRHCGACSPNPRSTDLGRASSTPM